VLTRRVLRDAQVRSLYSPPSREPGGRSRRDRSDHVRRIARAERCSGALLVHAAVPILRAWRSGLRACLPNRRCSVRSRPPAPTCHRLVLRVRRFQRWTSRVELPLAEPHSRTKFLGASPSWPRRRILIPVIAGSSPAALTNSSRGLGREGAGSHKAGVAGSTPVPATISGGSGTGWTRCVRRSSTAHYEIGGHSIS
jgi:hypothetical protein